MAETDPASARTELSRVRGFLVLMPLKFLDKESTIIPFGKEGILPNSVWVQQNRNHLFTMECWYNSSGSFLAQGNVDITAFEAVMPTYSVDINYHDNSRKVKLKTSGFYFFVKK